MELNYDILKTWDLAALKQYLRKRGLSVVGRKEMLISRAFAAYEMKVIVYIHYFQNLCCSFPQ
jgi:hypothetical protein